MSDHQQHDLLAALGRAVDRARADRAAGTPGGSDQGDASAADRVDRADEPAQVEQVAEIKVEKNAGVEHDGLRGASRERDDAEGRTRQALPSRSAGELEHQIWEQRVPGTDIATTRVHLHVDDHGRVTMHEAIAAQLLVDAGWERAS